MVSVLLVNGREPQGVKSQPLSLEAFRDHELSSDRGNLKIKHAQAINCAGQSM